MSEPENRSLGQRLVRTVETKVVIPLAAAVVGAGVSYLVRKLPLILEEKVLPKLLETGAPEKVTEVVEQTAAALGDSAPTTDGSGEASEGASEASGTTDLSDDEREEERRRREQRRKARKRALSA